MFKLFGGQKKNPGFYLELDENEESQPAPEPAADFLRFHRVRDKNRDFAFDRQIA